MVQGWFPYLRTGVYSSFFNPWPRPDSAVFFIESPGAVFKRTVIKRMMRRTRAGLNREPLNLSSYNFISSLKTISYGPLLEANVSAESVHFMQNSSGSRKGILDFITVFG